MQSLDTPGTMTPKERVRTTLARGQADRVPISYCANPEIDKKLKAHFGLTEDDGEGLLQALGVDIRGISVPYTGARLFPELPDRKVDPIWGIRTRWVDHGQGGYWDFCDFPLRNATEEEVAALPTPSPDDFDYSQVLPQCEALEGYAIAAGGAGLGDILNSAGMIRGMDQIMMDLMTEEPAFLLWIDRRKEINLEITRRTLEAAQGHVDFLWLGEDLGGQNAPLISLERYRAILRPRHQEYIDLAKSFDLPVMIHTCGSSSWVYDDFIEMGVDAVDTLQPEAKDMAPAYLKERFGDRLAFHGCISTAGAVSFGTVEDVERECRETLEIMMPGGGYCFSPTHALQDNSPLENVLTMYKTAHEYGRYL